MGHFSYNNIQNFLTFLFKFLLDKNFQIDKKGYSAILNLKIFVEITLLLLLLFWNWNKLVFRTHVLIRLFESTKKLMIIIIIKIVQRLHERSLLLMYQIIIKPAYVRGESKVKIANYFLPTKKKQSPKHLNHLKQTLK